MLNASRSSSEPHHHARQAALLNKNSSATVAIAGGVNPNTYHPTNSQHRKDGPTAEALERRNEAGELERQDWKALDLGGQGLHALSNTLFTYTFLDKLYINHNKLTKLPAAIGRLKLLQLLDASSNQLTELPPELGMLTNLRQLLLFDNQLTVLPFEIGGLYQLDVIGLEGNPLQNEYKSVMMDKGTRELIVGLRDNAPSKHSFFNPVEHGELMILQLRTHPASETGSSSTTRPSLIRRPRPTSFRFLVTIFSAINMRHRHCMGTPLRGRWNGPTARRSSSDNCLNPTPILSVFKRLIPVTTMSFLRPNWQWRNTKASLPSRLAHEPCLSKKRNPLMAVQRSSKPQSESK